MSKIVKSRQVLIENQKYVLSNEVKKEEEEVIEIVANSKGEDLLTKAQADAEALLLQATEDAKAKVDQAQAEFDKILSDAYDQSQGILNQAREDGYNEGFQKGFEEGKATSDQMIQETLQMKNQTIAGYKDIMDNAEREVIDLVIETVETILNRRIDEDYEIIEGIIGKAIKKATHTELLTLRVSNDDYSYAIGIKDTILSMAEKVDDIVIKNDSSLVNGSCIIDTDSGSIDSSIWTQFEQIKAMFEDLMRNE